MHRRFQTLEDFLIANPLTIDGEGDDGWGERFAVRGREIVATVLFADISRFSARTAGLGPAATLVFVNTFLAWISAEALQRTCGIIDKYIGDEIMIVFSREFGSSDPFVDAVQAARAMGESDYHSFEPHIGIASGEVIVGYTGTRLKHSCSVFGAPVATASRCASVKPLDDIASTRIVFPAKEWGGRSFDTVVPPRFYRESDGSRTEKPRSWEIRPEREVEMKNLGMFTIREIENLAFHRPMFSETERANEIVREARALRGRERVASARTSD